MPGFQTKTPATGYVIATSPNRTVRNPANKQQKYVTVRTDGKFQFHRDLNAATVFPSMGLLQQALGKRARLLQRGPTADLIILQTEGGGLRVVAQVNG